MWPLNHKHELHIVVQQSNPNDAISESTHYLLYPQNVKEDKQVAHNTLVLL